MIDFYPNERVAGNVNSSVLSYDARNQALISEWQQWASEATPVASEGRAQALKVLISCLEQNNKELCLSHLNLTSLPTHLPPFIEKLVVENNLLSSLPDQLPASLMLLNVQSNGLNALPMQLPPALVELYTANNELTCLSDSLPATLKILSVHHNQLDRLPNLPTHLTDLVANNNYLESLPTQLPVSLQELNIANNQLILLPTSLPATLQRLNIANNGIEMWFPERLPVSLQYLNMAENRIEWLPNELPAGLEQLDIANNRLKWLPITLPINLQHLNVSHNELQALPIPLPVGLVSLYVNDNDLTCLPDLPLSLKVLDYRNNPLSPLPLNLPPFVVVIQDNTIESVVSGFTTQVRPWEAIRHETHVNHFRLFLEQLQKGINNNASALRERIGDWLCYLAKEENKALRTNTFLVAQEASGGCVDRTAFYFNKMYLLMLEDQLIKTKMPVVELFNTNLALFRLQQLEKIAAQKAETRRGLSSGFAEELEIYLAYECLLREELSLPIYSELQHAAIAQLTDNDLTRAKQEIEQQEKAGFIGYLINESASWQARLTQWDRPQVESVEEAYLDFIGSDDFSQQVNEQLMKDKIDIRDADAHRTVSTEIAAKRLYQQRYQLTREFLAAQGQLALLDGFNSKREA